MNSKEILFEQYKLFVECAEKNSSRRNAANNYFLAVNSFLISFSAYLISFDFAWWHLFISVAGISVCVLWSFALISYRNLNESKFQIIHKIEKKLPVKLYKEERDYLTKKKKTHKPLSIIERAIPFIFLCLYGLIIFYELYPLIKNVIITLI